MADGVEGARKVWSNGGEVEVDERTDGGLGGGDGGLEDGNLVKGRGGAVENGVDGAMEERKIRVVEGEEEAVGEPGEGKGRVEFCKGADEGQ